MRCHIHLKYMFVIAELLLDNLIHYNHYDIL